MANTTNTNTAVRELRRLQQRWSDQTITRREMDYFVRTWQELDEMMASGVVDPPLTWRRPKSEPSPDFPVGSVIKATKSCDSITGDKIEKDHHYIVVRLDPGGWPVLHSDHDQGGGWRPDQFVLVHEK